MVSFPYFKHSSAQLAEKTVEADLKYPLDLDVAGPLTLHRVKYTHHVDGEAHFSQDGKILTRIRKRGNSFQVYSGRLFTVQLQGLSDFQELKDGDLRKKRQTGSLLAPVVRTNLSKLVAHLYSAADVARRSAFTTDAGPWIRVIRDEKPHAAVLLAVGDRVNPTGRILTLSFEEVATVFPNQPSGLSFIGGFDAPERALES
jgi:hypothetical protein